MSKQSFVPDGHTVALYLFDEGMGYEAHDACGDPALTLRARIALWGERPGFGATARFTRRADDANVFVGPVNSDKLQLRTCTEEWTVEAWVRYTGAGGQDGRPAKPRTCAYICATDDDGFGLRGGHRGGWCFSLHSSRPYVTDAPLRIEDGLVPQARFLPPIDRTRENGVWKVGLSYNPDRHTGARPAAITDQGWHHVAWQFRYKDQLHTLFLDGRLIWKATSPGGKQVLNGVPDVCTPFVVGGCIHSQDPPFHLEELSFEGEIDELRISDVMRYPVAERLAIVRELPPETGLYAPYSFQLHADAAQGPVTWEATEGSFPTGLVLDEQSGRIHGAPQEIVDHAQVTVRAADTQGRNDEHVLGFRVKPGSILTPSAPVAFAGLQYRHRLRTQHMIEPVEWTVSNGHLPRGMSLESATGDLRGVPAQHGLTGIRIHAQDSKGQEDSREITLKVVMPQLRHIEPDEHTVALYDWQGPNGRFIKDVMGDEELTLTWVNMRGDTRLPRPGWGQYPFFVGGGEHGFSGPQHNDKLDLRTCTEEWTVEAWVRRGGPVNQFDKPFDFGHICGTYDTSERGVWELYLSDHGSPDGSMAPGAHFLGADPNQALKDLHPWKRPDGLVSSVEQAGIHDTEWHHVAWQYSYEHDLHQLYLDGTLIWQMMSSDRCRVKNNRRHDAQFSVGSRLSGYARYGGGFNFMGWGNFFGQIGEIRISSILRYG